MITIFTPILSERINYTLSFVFNEVLKVEWKSTSDLKGFHETEGVRINYSPQKIENAYQIVPAGFLIKKGWSDAPPKAEIINEIPYLFPTEVGDSKFDLFSAVFYLISRYEEYNSSELDHYSRFLPEKSIAYQYGFLQKPVVDIWCFNLLEELNTRFNFSIISSKKYNYLNTIDVDNAYAYLEKGFVRTIGAIARSVIFGRFDELKERLSCLFLGKHDPFDTFDYLVELQKKYRLTSIYFFLVGDYDLNDKNVPVSSRKFQSLIKHMGDYATIAIHPSFASNDEAYRLKMEIDRLSKVVHKKIVHSRHHFLKLSLPTTYNELIKEGVTDDYTMGYASESGFRAGTCTPFYFYDLTSETTTSLKVHPFQFMEATYRHYKNQTPKEALDKAQHIIAEIKAVNGTFVTLWHNDSLSEIEPWEGWRSLYKNVVIEATATS